MKILAYQPHISPVTSVEARRRHVNALASAIEARCQTESDIRLVVLPELSTTDYSIAAFERLAALAEPLEGETFYTFATLARRTGCAICYGFPRVEAGQYFISQMVVGRDGQYLTHFDKLHLAQFGFSAEKGYFSRGYKLGIFELEGFRFGLIICYDFRFAELISGMVERYNLDTILHPVAFAKDDSYPSWPHFVICRALENHVYFLSLNRAGEQWGQSMFCPPWIDDDTQPTVFGQGEEIRTFTLDKIELQIARETYPFRLDRLTDYQGLK